MSKGWRPPRVMRQGLKAFSRFSNGDSDIHISCEEKDEPAFEPLQGNPSCFRVSTSRCPFYMRKQTLGPTHTPIAEKILLLRCLWKAGFPLESKPGNQLSSRDDLQYTELSSSCCAELCVLNLGQCSG